MLYTSIYNFVTQTEKKEQQMHNHYRDDADSEDSANGSATNEEHEDKADCDVQESVHVEKWPLPIIDLHPHSTTIWIWT